MYEWLLQNAQGWEKLLEFLLLAFSIVGGVVSWFWRKVSGRVSEGVSGVATGQAALMSRIDDLERDVAVVKTRLSDVEKGMINLAILKELAVLDRHLAALSASVEAQGTTLRMICEAAMRADNSSRKP